jgi:hypothetical protein
MGILTIDAQSATPAGSERRGNVGFANPLILTDSSGSFGFRA